MDEKQAAAPDEPNTVYITRNEDANLNPPEKSSIKEGTERKHKNLK